MPKRSMYISPKPKISLLRFALGGVFIWVGALLPSKFDSWYMVLIGACCAVLGSFVMMFSATHVWEGKDKEPGVYVKQQEDNGAAKSAKRSINLQFAKSSVTLRRVLAFVAVVLLAFVLALIAIPSAVFPLKSYLDSQKLLESTISFFAVVTGGFVAGLILTVVNERIQTYAWRRDQALKDIETIYEPLYWDVSRVAAMAESLDRPHIASQVTSWGKIRDSYFGSKLGVMEERLYKDLQGFFDDYLEYGTRRENALDIVATVAKVIIEKRLDEKMAKGNYGLREAIPRAKPGEPVTTVRDQILAEMPKRLDWGYEIFRGLLKGKSVPEWSRLRFGDEGQYFRNVVSYVNESGASYSTYIKFGAEEIETILDELYHDVRANAEINKSVAWCEDYSQRAQRLKSNLEVCILRPQLP